MVSSVQARAATKMGRSPGNHMLAPTTATKSGAGVMPRGNGTSRKNNRSARATMIPMTSLLFRGAVVMDSPLAIPYSRGQLLEDTGIRSKGVCSLRWTRPRRVHDAYSPSCLRVAGVPYILLFRFPPEQERVSATSA
jgi:hypothetical protein